MLNIMQNNLEVRGEGSFSISEILEAKTPSQTINYLCNPSPFPFSLIFGLVWVVSMPLLLACFLAEWIIKKHKHA